MTLTSDTPPDIVASRSVSVPLEQGGGTVGEASISGTLTHGSIVTLSDPQNRLGTRTNTAFRHWQQGSEIVLNGTASAAEEGASVPDTTEVWTGVADNVGIVTDNLRHARIDQQYRALGKGSTINARAFDGIGDEPKFYFAKHVYAGSQYNRTYVLGYSGLSGAFSTNPERTRGEPITISLVGGGSKTGYMISIINAVMTIEIIGGTGPGGSSVIDGATVTGDQSGASVVIDASTYGAAGAVKVARVYNGNTTSGQQGITVVPSHNGGLIDVDDRSPEGVWGDLANDYSGIYYSTAPKEWHLYELEIDFSGDSGVVRQRIDNGEIYSVSGLDKTNLSSSRGFHLSNVGLDTAGLGVSVDDMGLSEDWGEIVADNELKRLVIGDAPILADCTQIEIQNHTSWAAGSAEFKVNQGAFESLSGKYLFAVGPGFSELLQVAL